ncbi:accessory gene regulator ArgB-like protein [Paenibacillus xanthanilyticus]|uniref:Accessory gene regulator ArgB-like protein n=1 Tax=Paenibacillus xanthanilyticus TaxID=1783531 RepID=A0ABV8KAS2_9BACL
MLQYMSGVLAAELKRRVPEHPASEAVLKFSISFILNTVFVVIFSLILSVFTGKTSDAITVLIVFAVLRQFSGGIHLRSGVACVVVSAIGTTLISYADFNYTWTILLNVVAILLVLIYAPSNIDKQTRIPKKYYPFLKGISLVIVGVNFFIANPVISAAFLVQGITLVRRWSKRG